MCLYFFVYIFFIINSFVILVHGSYLEQRTLLPPNDLLDTKSKLHSSWHKSLCLSLLMQWLVMIKKIGNGQKLEMQLHVITRKVAHNHI